MGSFAKPTNSDEKYIFDVDTGSDDSLAIFLALRNEKYKNGPRLIAITCVYGTTTIRNVVTNTLRTLVLADRCDIPVHVGAGVPILKKSMVQYNPKSDGFGNFFELKEFYSLPFPTDENAVQALIRLVNEYPGDITLFAMGPLTNIAMALKVDKHFITKLNKLVINGGSFPIGYQLPAPKMEYNFYLDPEASAIVLSHSNYRNVLILLWDRSVIEPITVAWRKCVFGILDRPEIQFLNKSEFLGGDETRRWRAPDSLAFVSHICPSILNKIEPLAMRIATEGESRGLLRLDYAALKKISNCNISGALEFDLEEFCSELLHIFQFE